MRNATITILLKLIGLYWFALLILILALTFPAWAWAMHRSER